MALSLCRLCNARFGNAFPLAEGGECHICKGALERFTFPLPKPFGESYSLSITIPKEYLVREEDVLDLSFGESLKSYLSRKARERLKALGLPYKPNEGDMVIKLSFPSGKVEVGRGRLYIFGRYWKLASMISQKRWKGKPWESIEGIVGEAMVEVLGGKNYYMHASGREDVDAENEAGRAFVMEIVEPNLFSFSPKALEEHVNKRAEGKVKVELYGRVGGEFVTLVSDSHFDKAYRAYLSEELSEEEQEKVKKALEGAVIRQRTPTRVLRRRANILRKRRVFRVSFGRDERGFYMYVLGEAGLYIKELVSGDSGRTTPSVAEVVGRPIQCTHLVVADIKDGFLDLQFQLRYGGKGDDG